MRCKVILSKGFSVEIISALERLDPKNILFEIKEFDSYSNALEYVLSKECIYSSFLVIEIADLVMVIPKREIGMYDNFTLLKAFVTKDKAEKYRNDCYNEIP
ncbi:MAG: hypothetical protein J6I85_04065 [Clostridia bacterium]|nr:hypothetical protein [Clostridia bacterium]